MSDMLRSRGDVPAPYQPLSIAGLLRLLWRRRIMILACTAALMLVNVVVVLQLPPTYRAEALLQLDRRANRAVDGNVAALPADLDGAALASQAAIIRSPALALEVIAAERLLEHEEFRPALAEEGPPAGWRFALDEAWARLQALEPAWLRGLRLSGQDEAAASAAPANGEAAAVMQRQRREEAAIAIFHRGLRVSYDLNGATLTIRYVSRDPLLAERAANATAAAYVAFQIGRKVEMLHDTGEWLDTRLEGLRARTVEAEDRLAAFRQQHRLGTSEAPALTQRQLADLNAQLTEILGQEANAASRWRIAETAMTQQRLDEVPEVTASRTIQGLREQEGALARRLGDLTSLGNVRAAQNVAGELAELQRRIDQEQQRIAGSLRNELETTRIRRSMLEAAIERLSAEAGERERFAVRAALLEREALANRAVFDAAVRRTEETRLLDGLQRPDVSVVSPARIPGQPFQPRVGLILIAGLFASGAASAGLALLLSLSRPGIRSIAQGETTLGIMGLGWIPAIRARPGRAVHDLVVDAPTHLMSAGVRSTALAVKAFTKGEPKVVLVTSAIGGEGKTTFAISYARAMAAAGRQCLLIDADSHRQASSRRLAAGQADASTERAPAKPLPIISGLTLQQDSRTDLCFAALAEGGTDSLRVFGAGRLDEIIKGAAGAFDTIILDAPPVLAAPDAVVLARHADVTLLVVGWAATPARLVVEALQRLDLAGARGVGFVLSQVDVAQIERTAIERYAMEYGQSQPPVQAPPARLRVVLAK